MPVAFFRVNIRMAFLSACSLAPSLPPFAQFSRTVASASRNSGPGSRTARASRRAFLRETSGVLAATVAAALASTAGANPAEANAYSGRQVVNGVLSGYGLPTLPDGEGLTALLEQYDRLIVEVQYPGDWVVARNVIAASQTSAETASATGRLSFGSATSPMEGRGAGLTIGDYRKAEGVSFFVSASLPDGAKSIQDLPVRTILDLVTPGDATGLAEYTVVKDVMNSETGYRTIFSKYESTTLSGYTVPRRGFTSAIVLSDGKLYCLSGTCSDVRIKKIGDKLRASVDSFRVYRL